MLSEKQENKWIKNPRATDFYTVPTETESTIQTLWSANHINKYHHCEDVYTFEVPVYPGF